MKNIEKANSLFATNPTQKKVHFTKDGMPFFEEHKARNHAQRFADKSIETFSFSETEYGQQVLAKQKAKSEAEAKAKEAEALEAQKLEEARIEALEKAKEAEAKAKEEAEAKAKAVKK